MYQSVLSLLVSTAILMEAPDGITRYQPRFAQTLRRLRAAIETALLCCASQPCTVRLTPGVPRHPLLTDCWNRPLVHLRLKPGSEDPSSPVTMYQNDQFHPKDITDLCLPATQARRQVAVESGGHGLQPSSQIVLDGYV